MTDKELLQEALDVMLAAIKAGDWKVDGACDPDLVIHVIKSRLSQVKQKDEKGDPITYWGSLARSKKEWVGLTAYEIQEIHISNPHFGNFACAIEAKLKEKNA